MTHHIHTITRGRLPRRAAGFTLIENMVAILLLTVAALGIGASTSTSIRINADNQARAMMLSAATAALEPVYLSTLNSDDFHTAISALSGAVPEGEEPQDCTLESTDPNCLIVNAGLDPIEITVVEAVDAAGVDVLTVGAPYTSPVTAAVLVRYTEGILSAEADESDLAFLKDKAVRASFTFVLAD